MIETFITDWGMALFYITFALVSKEINHRNEVKDDWNIYQWLRNDTIYITFTVVREEIEHRDEVKYDWNFNH